jgi:hypothetical protein
MTVNELIKWLKSYDKPDHTVEIDSDGNTIIIIHKQEIDSIEITPE